MDKAKAAVSGFLSKDGKHDTTVHETVSPAVVNEHITRTHHEEAQKVIDREVHQDHHHTSIQPIQDREVLPERHTHNLVGTEHREIKHGNDDHIRARLEQERAQFKDTREIGETQRTTSEAPVVAGEHIHHHVHEHIQPVIQKETIQPSVVHTTIPVHEIHRNEAKHHTATALPAVTMDEFQRQGGALGGREERTDSFAGEPRSVGESLSGGNRGNIGGPGAEGTTSVTDGSATGGRGSGLTGREGLSGRQGTTGTDGYNDSNLGTTSTTGSTGTTGTKKASLLDKINPKVDSTGDGVAGFMK